MESRLQNQLKSIRDGAWAPKSIEINKKWSLGSEIIRECRPAALAAWGGASPASFPSADLHLEPWLPGATSWPFGGGGGRPSFAGSVRRGGRPHTPIEEFAGATSAGCPCVVAEPSPHTVQLAKALVRLPFLLEGRPPLPPIPGKEMNRNDAW